MFLSSQSNSDPFGFYYSIFRSGLFYNAALYPHSLLASGDFETNVMDLQGDEIRGVRQRKKNCDPTCCPVCGITVRSTEIEQHYSMELEKLHKQSATKRKSLMASIQKDQPGCSSSNAAAASSSAVDAAADDSSECWVTYQRIKNNRQARLKVISFFSVSVAL